MRSLILTAVMTLGPMSAWAIFPPMVKSQSAAGTPAYAQPNYSQGDWTSHFYGPPYYNWRGQQQWHSHEWMWQNGRSFYPGYRYYSYPQSGVPVYGGGRHYLAPGYYHPPSDRVLHP